MRGSRGAAAGRAQTDPSLNLEVPACAQSPPTEPGCAGLLFLPTHHPIHATKSFLPFEGMFEKKREAVSKPRRSWGGRGGGKTSLCLSFPP